MSSETLNTGGAFSQAKDLKNRIIFTILILIIYRLGTYVPLTGIDPLSLKEIMASSQKGLLGMFNMFSGGAVTRMAIFALGIMPYISASIIVQLLTGVSDYFKNLKEQGEIGRKKITQITRYGTVLIACLQGYGVSVGNKMYGGESSHLPLKINTAGVIPAIFASALLLLPVTISNFGFAESDMFLKISSMFTQGQPLYMLLYASGIIFFSFFYTSIVFNPKETSENLRKYGGYIPGIRPGERTAEYIETILIRLTTVGSLYLTFVCLMPEFLIAKYPIPFYLGGTSILIVVVVAMDTVTQVQTRLMSSQYESLIKKTKFGK